MDPSTNPLLHVQFDIPFDQIRAEHVQPAIGALLQQAEERIAAIVADDRPRTYENTLSALEEADYGLDHAMGIVSHLESVATTPELREAHNAVQPLVSAFASSIPMNPGLWKALNAFAATEEARTLSPTRRRFLDKKLADFRRHGALLDEPGKEKLRVIEVELAQICTRYSQNLLDATNAFELYITDEAGLRGLPQSAIEGARESAEKRGQKGWRFTLHEPSLVAMLTYLDDASTRERMFRAHTTRATSEPYDNRPLCRRILELRRDKARLLGFADFSDLVLEDRMARRGDRAHAFADELYTRTRPFFEKEKAQLMSFRRQLEGADAGPLQAWDVGYYAEKQRRALFDFDEEELRPYLSADRVLSGMFSIAEQLYGVRIVEGSAPAWDEAVRCYSVLDDGGAMRAAFYVDLHPRENKRGGAWMNALITGVKGVPGREGRHLGLFCANVQPPVAGKPSLLLHREVETLFHEFGHLLHHALTSVEVRSLAGTNVAWDFVELPSQIMENFCWEREALDRFARHYQSGSPVPDELYQKMQRARSYRAASAMMRQLGFARLDLMLHRRYHPDADGDVMEYARRILQEHAAAPLPQDYAMLAGFSHLFTAPVAYASGYYSYKWAEVLDADAFSRFKSEGILNPRVGAAFRDSILSRGDSEDPMKLFVDFMGREPRLDALFERDGLVETQL